MRPIESNRTLWDAWTRLHEKSAFYDVEGFKAGKLTLKPVERKELGDVAGKSLLHLQCHFGLDTLSWARLGARVTGVDFSEEAITLARKLSDELDLPARFICSDVLALPQVLDEKFDIVFTSYGVLPWLPDVRRWAEVVAHCLAPGGTFYLLEFHPIGEMLDEAGEQFAYPYFEQAEPLAFEAEGSYAAPATDVTLDEFNWPHSVGEVVTALLEAGLRLEFLHEFPYSTYPFPSFVKEVAPDLFERIGIAVPLMYSIRAVKPGG